MRIFNKLMKKRILVSICFLIILLLTSTMRNKPGEDEQPMQTIKGSFTTGKIIKGTLTEAPTKMRKGSIPNKYQNIIYPTNSTTGFGASARYGSQSFTHQAIQPGPGFYNIGEGQKKPESKKGNGFFASKTKLNTLERSISEAPGPGAYTATLIHKQGSAGGRVKSNSQSIGHQLFKNELQASLWKPGVGAYKLNPEKMTRDHSLPVFKSKINRFQQPCQKSPPVGLYELTQGTLNRPSSKNVQLPPKDYVRQKQNQHHKVIERAIKSVVSTNKGKANLEPGSYNPSLASITKSFKISQNMYDRFGQLKPIFLMAKTIQAENTNNFLHDERGKLGERKVNSIFKSNTKKWEIELKDQMDPGKYNSNKSPSRVSHLINFARKWV